MEGFVGYQGGHGAGSWSQWPLLVAFIVTIVPFYHGAMRHLDRTYVEEQGQFVRRGALLADFLLLFGEAGILLGMAIQFDSCHEFAWWLALLLAFDAIWGAFVLLTLTRRAKTWPQFRWALLNCATVVVLVVVLNAAPETAEPNNMWAVLVMATALLRSAIDYAASWGFYFPAEAERPA